MSAMSGHGGGKPPGASHRRRKAVGEKVERTPRANGEDVEYHDYQHARGDKVDHATALPKSDVFSDEEEVEEKDGRLHGMLMLGGERAFIEDRELRMHTEAVDVKHELTSAIKSSGAMLGVHMTTQENNPKDAAIQLLAIWCDPSRNYEADEYLELLLEHGGLEVLCDCLVSVDQGGTVPDRLAEETYTDISIDDDHAHAKFTPFETIQVHAIGALFKLIQYAPARRRMLRGSCLGKVATVLRSGNSELAWACMSVLDSALRAEMGEIKCDADGTADLDIDFEASGTQRILIVNLVWLIDDYSGLAQQTKFKVVSPHVEVFKDVIQVQYDLSQTSSKPVAALEKGDVVEVDGCHIMEDGGIQVHFCSGRKKKLTRRLPRSVHGWCMFRLGEVVPGQPPPPANFKPVRHKKEALVAAGITNVSVNIISSLAFSSKMCTAMLVHKMDACLAGLLDTYDFKLRFLIQRIITERFGRKLEDMRSYLLTSTRRDRARGRARVRSSFQKGDLEAAASYDFTTDGVDRAGSATSIITDTGDALVHTTTLGAALKSQQSGTFAIDDKTREMIHGGLDDLGSNRSRRSNNDEEYDASGTRLVHKGWMDKKVGITPLWRHWWCELYDIPPTLSSVGDAYLSMSKSSETGEAKLGAKKQLLDQLRLNEVQEVAKGVKNTIDLEGRRTLRFNCDNPIEKEEWVKELKSVHQNAHERVDVTELMLQDGWLNRKVGITAKWKRMWVQLVRLESQVSDSAVLRFFKQQVIMDVDVAVHELSLDGCTEVMMMVKGEGDQEIDLKYGDKVNHRLKAPDLEECEVWMDRINEALTHMRKGLLAAPAADVAGGAQPEPELAQIAE